MTSRKRPGLKHPKPKASIDPALVIPPLVPATAEARRVTAREAANRLAKMTPEEQAAALFQSMGAQKKR